MAEGEKLYVCLLHCTVLWSISPTSVSFENLRNHWHWTSGIREGSPWHGQQPQGICNRKQVLVAAADRFSIVRTQWSFQCTLKMLIA